MKDLFKIYLRYILTATAICLLIIIFNFFLFFFFLLFNLDYKAKPEYKDWNIARLSEALTLENGTYTFSDKAAEKIDCDYAFAMLIDQQGQVVWSQNLPDEIPLSYSLTDVASFSRWYLKDYSVTVWEHTDGLFVTADPKGAFWKQNMKFPLTFVEASPLYFLAVLLLNLLLILLLAFLFGHRLYTSLMPLAQGIENLTSEEILHLPESGLTEGLSQKLNQASLALFASRKSLEKRDNARTSWIAGVSHDIRTPLSLIMGHADSLEHSPNLSLEEQKEAASIKEHSLQIKNLIADLNLTSKLEYDSYPLRLKKYSPASLLRQLAAYYLNDMIREPYTLTSQIDTRLESIRLTGDTDLLLRALRNLMDNSLRHNPDGCALCLQAEDGPEYVKISVSDTGCGIPVKVIKNLYWEKPFAEQRLSAADASLQNTASPSETPHIGGMGLRIVKQITEAHGGHLEFKLQKDICLSVVLHLPKTFPTASGTQENPLHD